MKKKILCLIMITLMIIGSTITAQAEDYQGSRDWTVDFDGSGMESNFKSAEMTEDILQILPGDSITLQINLRNTDDRKTDWYMTNEILQSLEDSSEAAEGGAYTYKLSYFNPEGAETVLYNSEVVGGEGNDSQGLHQATEGLENFFYLDRLEKDEKAVIRLYVGLDGETQGNDYQDTLAKIKMNFAVEKVYDDVITETVTKTNIVYLANAAKTGDSAPIVLLSVLALISGVALVIAAVVIMKRKKQEKGSD